MGMEIALIVAYCEKTRAIGNKNNLIWHIKEDMKRFKSLTVGNAVIMGRKTWESIGRKPLPDRLNIVLTRAKKQKQQEVTIAHSIEEALKLARESGVKIAWVIGGEAVYNEFLSEKNRHLVRRVEATEIGSSKDGDAHFPELPHCLKTATSISNFSASGNTPAFSWVRYENFDVPL